MPPPSGRTLTRLTRDPSREGYEARARANNPSLTPAMPDAVASNAGATLDDQRDQYEARAAANNPSLTPLHRSPMAVADQMAAGPALTAPPSAAPGDGSIDMLAYGKENNIPRPAGTPAPAAPMMTAAPPPPPPQTERVNPLSGDTSKVMPGQSAPFTQPHVGGEGSYMRNFSNPTSAGMYSSFVKSLFPARKTTNPQKTPLSRTPASQLAYTGM